MDSAQELNEFSQEGLKKANTEKPKKTKKPSKIKIKQNILRTKLKEYLKSKKDTGSFIKDFIFYIIAYGIPITYMFWAFIICKSYWLKIPAFGFAFYLLKEELPHIWSKFRGSRR